MWVGTRSPTLGGVADTDPFSLNSPLSVVRAGHGAVQHVPGVSRQSSAFLDHAMAPTSSWPCTMYGSLGLMRGDESWRKVPSSATRAEVRRGHT